MAMLHKKTSTFNMFCFKKRLIISMFLCRRRFYSDLRRSKKLGASGFWGGGAVTFQIYWPPGPGQWLQGVQELNVEGELLTGAWESPPAFDVINNVVLIL